MFIINLQIRALSLIKNDLAENILALGLDGLGKIPRSLRLFFGEGVVTGQ